MVVSHRHATIVNALIKTWSATTTFSIFKQWSCSAKYIVINCKKCNFAIESDIFDCQKRSFAFFKNSETGSPGHVRAYSVSSLIWTLISWIYYCLLCRISFFFLSIFDHLPIGIILRISWDKTLPMSPLTNYSKLMRFSPNDQTSSRTCSIERASTNNIDIL